MALSADCPMGRSQLFTFEAKEAITVDRATIQELLGLLKDCAMDSEFASNNSIFLESLKAYLSGIDTPEGHKTLILLSPWLDTVPEALEELTEKLNKAKEIFQFILAVSHD